MTRTGTWRADPAEPWTGEAPRSPGVARVRRARWSDTRTLLGVVLLLASVAVGARVLSTGADTTPVLAVTADLPAGHVLTPTDLGISRVRLDDSSSRTYLDAARRADVVGRVLARGVGRGELLPASSVAGTAAAPARMVPVKVRDGRLPTLARGDRVDVFATVAGRPVAAASGTATTATSVTGGACVTVPVVTDAQVGEAVPETESGTDVTVQLLVPPAEVGPLILASEAGAVDLVRHVAVGDQQGDVGTDLTTGLGRLPSVASCGARS